MRIVFAGSPGFAANALEAISKQHEVLLVITKEDAPVGRKKELTESPVGKVANELNLKVLKTNRITPEVTSEIAAIGAELGIVIAYGALIPKEALHLYPWWNLHFSLLPSWRGATPLQRSMQHNRGVGITIFELDEGLDTGLIVAQEPLTFAPLETSGEALDRFSQRGTGLLLNLIGTDVALHEQVGDVSYAHKFKAEESFLDFSNDSTNLERIIRALNPEPVAWGRVAGWRVRVLRARSIGQFPWAALHPEALSTGHFTLTSNNQVLVRCGQDTALELIEIQPEGKRVMTAAEWFRGLKAECFFE